MDVPTSEEELALKADPSVQLTLLDVQELDSQIDTLTHQLATIPEAAAAEGSRAAPHPVDNGLRDLRIRVEDLTAEQKRADADVEQVKARRVRDQDMVDSGRSATPRPSSACSTS